MSDSFNSDSFSPDDSNLDISNLDISNSNSFSSGNFQSANVSSSSRAKATAVATKLPDLSPPNDPVESTDPTDSEPPAAPPVAPKKRLPLPVLIGLPIVLIVGGFFGLRWWHYTSTHESTDDAQLQGHVYQVSSRINGTVQTVVATDNQTVTAGETLVQLDPQTFQAQVDQAQAALSAAKQAAQTAQIGIEQASANASAQNTSAQGGISGANAGITTAQSTLTAAKLAVPTAQSQLTAANTTLENARIEAGRYQDLFVRGAVSAEQRDSYQQAYKTAQAQQKTAQEQLQQAQVQIDQAQAGIDKAQSELETSQGTLATANAAGFQTEISRSQYTAAQDQIKQAEASLKTAKLQLSYTKIEAPAAGTIGNKSVEPGTQVSIGQPLMAVVGQDFWVMANFKETQVANIQPGDPVTVTVDALGSQTLTGKVDSLSPASGSQFSLLPPDNATGNFTKVVQRIPIKIALDPSSLNGELARLSPGMSATVAVDIADNNITDNNISNNNIADNKAPSNTHSTSEINPPAQP